MEDKEMGVTLDERYRKFELLDNVEIYLIKIVRILIKLVQLVISGTLFIGFMRNVYDSNIYATLERIVIIINHVNPNSTGVLLLLGGALLLVADKLLYTILEFTRKK